MPIRGRAGTPRGILFSAGLAVLTAILVIVMTGAL